MIKVHSVVLVIVGMSTLVLGQTQGCDLSVLLNAIRPGMTSPVDDSRRTEDGGHDQSGNIGSSQEKILVATLQSTGAMHGEVKYRELGGRLRFSVEAQDATPGSMFAITVNGFVIGQITIGPLGKAEIEFDTQIEPGHQPWPPELSNDLAGGAVIAVGAMQGTLQGV